MNKCFVIICLLILFKTEAQISVLNTADSLYAIGNYSKAIASYKKHHNQDDIYHKIAMAYNAIGNYDEALNNYKNSVKANPNNALIKYDYAKLLYKTKKFHDALALFNALIKTDIINPNYYYQSGLVLEKLKDSTNQNQFKNAFLRDTTHQKAIFKIAKQFLKKGKHDSVQYYAKTGLKSYKNNVELIGLQAQSYYKQQQYNNAIKWFKKLITLNESSYFIHKKLSYSYANIIDYEKAIDHLLIALEYQPKDATNFFVLGEMYDRKGDFFIAEKYMKHAIKLLNKPLDNEYTKLAVVLNEQKKYEEAIETLKLAIRENPENSQAHFFMVIAKDKYYKDIDGKLKAFQDFNKKFPSNVYTPLINKRISELKLEKFRKENN